MSRNRIIRPPFRSQFRSPFLSPFGQGASITGRAFFFNGAAGSAQDDYVNLGKPAVTANIWAGGGSIAFNMHAQSDGEGDAGVILEKTNWTLATVGESGGNTRLRLTVVFDGTPGQWDTDYVFDLTKAYHVIPVYSSSLTANNLSVYYRCLTDGETAWTLLEVGSGITRTTAPVGTRVSDETYDLMMGNNDAFTNTFAGYIFDIRVYDSSLTSADRTLISTHRPTNTVPVQWIPCQDTPDDEPNIITGTDYDMTGANNWVNLFLADMDVNSTVANRLWMQAAAVGPGLALLVPITYLGGYKAEIDLRLKSGAAQDIDIMILTAGYALEDSFTVSPSSTEQTFAGFLRCSDIFLCVGSLVGLNSREYEMRYPVLKRLLATDKSGNGNDGIIMTNESGFFAEGVQTWV